MEHELAGLVDESRVRSNPNGGQAAGKVIGPVKLKCDDLVSISVDVAPLVPVAHGCKTLMKGPYLVVNGWNYDPAFEIEDAMLLTV